MSTLNPISNHSFQIEIINVTDNAPEYFYSIEGLAVDCSIDEYQEGGFKHAWRAVNKIYTSNVVLRRPLTQEKTNITVWCEQALNTGNFTLTQAHIMVVNTTKVIAQWIAEDIYPISIKITPFDITQGHMIITEKITLAYSSLKRAI